MTTVCKSYWNWKLAINNYFIMPLLYHRRQFQFKHLLSRSLRSLSLGVFMLAVAGFLLTFGPVGYEEAKYRLQQFSSNQTLEPASQPSVVSGFGLLLGQPVQADFPADIADPYFWIRIPKISASSKVIPNVDPGDRSIYLQALTQGVAHAAGTNFPGAGENIYLFAHSTDSPVNISRYNAVFYLLRELEPGDRVELYFLGRKYLYQVTGQEILDPKDLKYFQPSDHEQLILQTCWPPGTTWKRLVVVAQPVS
jgi:LPXTG-site transpeptidase (sortase) family protein